MKALRECNYSFFVSYSHADDEYLGGKIKHFSEELQKILRARLSREMKGERIPEAHISAVNGPISGRLATELRQNIEKSFAMVLVVYDDYPKSEWCQRELAYFREIFGQEGLGRRLFIVAMSNAAVTEWQGDSRWRDIFPEMPELVWDRCYHESSPNEPHPIYTSRNGINEEVSRLMRRLTDAIVKEARAVAAPATPIHSPRSRLPRNIVIGFVPDHLSAKVEKLQRELEKLSYSVTRVNGLSSLARGFPEFAPADLLIAPFNHEQPLLQDLSPGGHLAAQRRAWTRHGRTEDQITWLDVDTDAQARPADAEHAEWINRHAQPAVDATTLLARLSSHARTDDSLADCIRIYIESNQNERWLWEPLGDKIALAWETVVSRMKPPDVPSLVVRPRSLPIDDLDEYSIDDANGVILLWGRKSRDSLVDQINRIERRLPGRRVAPGIVAYLMPPQPRSPPMAAWGWNVVRFISESEDSVEVPDDETTALERFLMRMVEHHTGCQRPSQPNAAYEA